jgi:hypothetical protein
MTNGKFFESEVITIINWKRSSLLRHFTATQYANAIFSGLTPLEMEKQFPQYWKNPEEGGKTCMKQSFCRHN